MAQDEDNQEKPFFRYRHSIEIMVETLKTAVVKLHGEAATLSGWKAKELREIADDMDAYAEVLKERLKKTARI